MLCKLHTHELIDHETEPSKSGPTQSCPGGPRGGGGNFNLVARNGPQDNIIRYAY